MTTVIKLRIYMMPTRPLALEAAVFAACASQERMSKIDIGIFVYMHLNWAGRREIYTALERMIGKGRIVETYEKGRTLPFYTLPASRHAPHAPASPAARRARLDTAHALPA
jgi:hypothetical protein